MLPTSTNEKPFSEHNGEFNGKKPDLGKDFKDLSKMTGTLATDAMSLVQKNAHEYYDQGIKLAKNFGESVEGRIQKHPLQSLLIVAGVSLLLGTLWKRR